jgi:oxaloacetate decarboxylase gamma subunit
MQENIMAQGIELMIYGMGTVVVFLALLVIATMAMSAFIARYFPEAEKTTATGRVPKTAVAGDDPELVAVISAAIHQHRSGK